MNYFTLLIRQQCPRYLYTLYILSVSSELGIERGRNRELEAHKKKREERAKKKRRGSYSKAVSNEKHTASDLRKD